MLQQTSEKDLLNCWRAIARLAREFLGGSLVGSGCILAGGGFGIALSVFGENDGLIAVLDDGFLMVRGRGDGFIAVFGDDRIIVLDDGLITAFGRGDDLIMVLDDGLITTLRESVREGAMCRTSKRNPLWRLGEEMHRQ